MVPIEEAIIQASVDGERVLVVVSKSAEIPALLGAWAEVMPYFGGKIARAKGAERVGFPSGGSIRLCSERSVGYGAARGISVQRVYLPFIMLGRDVILRDLAPLLATVPGVSLTYSAEVP